LHEFKIRQASFLACRVRRFLRGEHNAFFVVLVSFFSTLKITFVVFDGLDVPK
jgi:hypothetical protein